MGSESEATVNRFQIEQDESLPEVLERLHGHRDETLSLVIADHSPILLTATEFRALKDLADRNHIRLSVETTDSLRLQLASMFGLAPPPVRREPIGADGDDHAHGFGSWRNVRRPRYRPAGQPPDANGESRDTPSAPEEDDPIAVSRRRRNSLYSDSVASARDETGDLPISDAGLDYIEDDDEGTHTRAWLYGRIAAVALVVLAVVFAALWYWFPAVTLDVTLREADISTGIVYSVAAPGAQIPSDAAFAVEASEQRAEVPFTIEIPASGIEREPDGTATGTLMLRNVGEAPVSLPAGTELTTVGGAGYALTEAVEVPAGTIDEPGEAEAPITATAAGAGGNAPAGGLTGKIPDQPVYYSNLGGPVDGGSDREYTVITEQDVAAAQEAVRNDLRAAAESGWTAQLPDGMAVVGPSVTPGDPAYSIEGAAGEQRDSVVVTGTVPVSGYVYSLADVEAQSRSSFEVALQDQVPPGYELDASTIQLGEPEMLAEAPENVEYRVEATATARAIFDEGAQNGLKERMAGASADDARGAIDTVGAIETWELSRDPGWWPDRMPQSTGRITLVVQEPGADASGSTPAASPASTPSAGDGS